MRGPETRLLRLTLLTAGGLLIPAVLGAEPHLLSKQYARCSTCHVSAAGGGQLTEYGRSLSDVELSTMTSRSPANDDDSLGEAGFLFGLLGDTGALNLGASLRPSRLHFSRQGTSTHRNLLMTADVTASIRSGDWVAYGEIGRKIRPEGGGHLDSHEYWAGRQPAGGLGFRAGRFLPAYGVRLADHTAFNRVQLGLAQYDQVFGLEVSHSGARHLVQISAGPGHADAVLDDDGRRAATVTGRVQVDLGSRMVLVGSGLVRDESRPRDRHGAVGVALGLAPASRVSIWTQLDGIVEAGGPATTYVLVNETSVEVTRGLWLKVSPQAVVGGGDRAADLLRLGTGAVFLPRTHWNVNAWFYRDRNRSSRSTSHTFLLQLHLYL